MVRNINKVQTIAYALREVKEQVVFIGGSVAELYADYPDLVDIRPTIDVDCLIDLQIVTYLDYSKLENYLRTLGFQNDISENAPICRKIYHGILVDFIPINPNILGFSNFWYKDGVKNKINVSLPDGTSIFIMPVEYYIATKLEAMNSRGGRDIRGSHDWEDIVFILDNCSRFLNNVKQCNNLKLKNYLKESFVNLLNNNNIKEIIYTALPYSSEEENVNKIFTLMNDVVIN